MKRFWNDIADGVKFLLLLLLVFATIVSATVWVLDAVQRSTIKYNCNLDRYPGWYTTLMIDDSLYAYSPEKFCAKVRIKMEEDK